MNDTKRCDAPSDTTACAEYPNCVCGRAWRAHLAAFIAKPKPATCDHGHENCGTPSGKCGDECD